MKIKVLYTMILSIWKRERNVNVLELQAFTIPERSMSVFDSFMSVFESFMSIFDRF